MTLVHQGRHFLRISVCKSLINSVNMAAAQLLSHKTIATPTAESAFCLYVTGWEKAFSTSCLNISLRARALPLPIILVTPARCRWSADIMVQMFFRIPWHNALVTFPRERLLGEMLVTWPKESGLCLSPRMVGLTWRSLVAWFRAQWISFWYKHDSLRSAPINEKKEPFHHSERLKSTCSLKTGLTFKVYDYWHLFQLKVLSLIMCKDLQSLQHDDLWEVQWEWLSKCYN